MARAISTVATTKTRKTRTAPTVVAVCCAKVTRLRLTPLSISSMHISMTSTLRRTMTPTSPSEKSATATPMSSCVLSMASLAADPDHRQRRHHRGDEQHRGELEQEPVFAQEGEGKAGDAVGGPADRHGRHGQRAPDADHDRAEQHDEAGDAGDEQLRIARRA